VQVEEASGGGECLELVKKNTYHMIFMDHMMPEMDGLETFDILKRQHLCDNIPVIAMTANTISMTEEDYCNHGFAAFIAKPIVPENLGKTVYELLDPALVTVLQKSEVIIQQSSTEREIADSEQTMDSSEKPRWKELPMVDGLDYHYAALHFQTVEEFKEMVRFLVEVMKSDRIEIESYFDTLDKAESLKNFQTKVHSMKNSAMTIGIVPLAGLAKTLEDAAQEENK